MWTQEQRNEFGNLLILTAKVYDKDISFEVAKLIISDIQDLDYGKCISGLNNYRRDPKNKFWPKASDIRNYADPTLDTDAKGKLAAARVIEAVSKFGYTHPEAAKEFIGDLGWQAVKRFGGWQYICENLGVTLQQLTFQAQIREICIATEKASALGMQDQPIQIGHTENNSRLESTNTLEKANYTQLLSVIKPSGGHNET